MALWVCTGCTARYSVGAAQCPQCGSTEYVEEGAAEMAKITVHGGPSIAGASVVGGAWSDEGDPDVWPEPAEDSGEGAAPVDEAARSSEKSEAAAEEPEKAPRQRRTRSK